MSISVFLDNLICPTRVSSLNIMEQITVREYVLFFNKWLNLKKTIPTLMTKKSDFLSCGIKRYVVGPLLYIRLSKVILVPLWYFVTLTDTKACLD